MDAGVGGGALGEEEVEDVVGGARAEELAESFFVPGDAVLLDEGEEVERGVAGEGGFGEVRVGGEEVFGGGVEVGEVAAASSGDEDFLARGGGVFEDEGAAAAAGGVSGAEEAGGSGSEDEDVGLGHGAIRVSQGRWRLLVERWSGWGNAVGEWSLSGRVSV